MRDAERLAQAEADNLDLQLVNEVKFEIVVSDETWADKVIGDPKTAYTGEYGDGKIFSYDMRTAAAYPHRRNRLRRSPVNAGQSKILPSEIQPKTGSSLRCRFSLSSVSRYINSLRYETALLSHHF